MDIIRVNGVHSVPIHMEHESFRDGNGLNTKAVMSVQNMYRGITCEEGESAVEALSHRYRILRSSKKCMKRVTIEFRRQVKRRGAA